MSVAYEGWLDKRAAAQFWACSTRSIELAITEGMPHAIIFGRVKVRPSEAEPWLVEHGYLELRGERVYDAPRSANGAATATTAPPHDREVSPDGKQA